MFLARFESMIYVTIWNYFGHFFVPSNFYNISCGPFGIGLFAPPGVPPSPIQYLLTRNKQRMSATSNKKAW